MSKMTRADWLQFEISLYEEELAGLAPESPRRASAEGALLEHRSELGLIEGDGGRLKIRLTGQAVHGNEAPADVVLAITRAMSDLADEFATNLYMAPAQPGSHIIKFVAPPAAQTRLALTDDEPSLQTFGESAGVLMGLANQGAPAETAPMLLEDAIGSLSVETLGIAKRLFGTLASRDVTLHIDAASRDLAGHRRVDREWASFVKSVLDDTTKVTESLTFQGRLEGLLRSALRFELETSGELIRGRFPASMRDELEGVRIPSDVTAIVDKVTTLLASGSTRSYYRLKHVQPAG